jgi:hypothetical protein
VGKEEVVGRVLDDKKTVSTPNNSFLSFLSSFYYKWQQGGDAGHREKNKKETKKFEDQEKQIKINNSVKQQQHQQP